MVKRVIKEFEVEYLQVLDENGNCDDELMPDLTNDQIKELYEWMVLVRVFDNKALALQRQGRMGTYAQYMGQEASQVGSVYPLEDKDWFIPTYRESGSLIVRKTPMVKLFQYWGGDERGSYMEANNLPISIPVGSQPLHATGLGMAANLKKEKTASLVCFGDGATSKGDVHEAMNFAGVFNAPVVFFCQNNQWAISVSVKQQTRAETLAQKAIAYGFEGIQIDGNDVFAVYKATKDALDKAKKGKGPTFIEAFTYRMADHTTSDDSFRYRPKSEVDFWKKRDPVDRLMKYMKAKNIVKNDYFKKVEADAGKRVENAVHEYESVKKADVEDVFKYTFREMTPELKEQMEDLKDD